MLADNKRQLALARTGCLGKVINIHARETEHNPAWKDACREPEGDRIFWEERLGRRWDRPNTQASLRAAEPDTFDVTGLGKLLGDQSAVLLQFEPGEGFLALCQQ